MAGGDGNPQGTDRVQIDFNRGGKSAVCVLGLWHLPGSGGGRWTADEVVAGLRALVAATAADELLITTQTWDPEQTRESHRLLAAAWAAAGAVPAESAYAEK